MGKTPPIKDDIDFIVMQARKYLSNSLYFILFVPKLTITNEIVHKKCNAKTIYVPSGSKL